MPGGIPTQIDIAGPVTGGDDFTLTVVLDSVVSEYVEIGLFSDNLSLVTGPSGTPFPTNAAVMSGKDGVEVSLGSAKVSESVTVKVFVGLQGANMPDEATASVDVVINPATS